MSSKSRYRGGRHRPDCRLLRLPPGDPWCAPDMRFQLRRKASTEEPPAMPQAIWSPLAVEAAKRAAEKAAEADELSREVEG